MASSFYVPFFCFLLFSLQSQARVPQSFNKASATTGDSTAAVEANKESQPGFVPESENQYGLYGRDSVSGEKPTFSGETQKDLSFNSHLPKNYNPVAYVTQPENFDGVKDSTFSGKENVGDVKDSVFPGNENFGNVKDSAFSGNENFGNVKDTAFSGKDLYNVADSQELDEVFPNSKTNDNRYYGGVSSFNSRENYFPSQPQGMSDTRSFANGKYFYDVNSERFSTSHPYETLKAADPALNRPYFSNRRNYGNEFSGAGEGYPFSQNQGSYGNWP